MQFDNSIIDESENFRGRENNSFKDICMRQVQRVVSCASQEMRAGFWIKSYPHPNMNPEKVRYIGDTRKELFASLDTLHDLLMPKFDKDMNKASKEVYEALQKLVDDKLFVEQKKLYRLLFQALTAFLDRLGWLESGEVEE